MKILEEACNILAQSPQKEKVYMICNKEDDLPVAVFDTITGVAKWLGCTRKAVYDHIFRENTIRSKYYVEIIFMSV